MNNIKKIHPQYKSIHILPQKKGHMAVAVSALEPGAPPARSWRFSSCRPVL
jgi:hypothetical protein